MTETWKPVKGYEGLYEVSDLGNVKSLARVVKAKGSGTRTIKDRLLKPQRHQNGYLFVTLSKDGVTWHASIHRLVAFHFVNCEGDMSQLQVNHINAKKDDNRAENLEWCTPQGNIRHAILLGNKKPAPGKRIMRSDGAVFESINAAARAIGTPHSNIQFNLRGERKHVKGYTFAYVD